MPAVTSYQHQVVRCYCSSIFDPDGYWVACNRHGHLFFYEEQEYTISECIQSRTYKAFFCMSQ